MTFIYLNNREQWPDVDPHELRRFLNEMFRVNPEVRWTGSFVTTDGRLYFHLDDWERPGDQWRRCRAFFDLATSEWHVSEAPVSQAWDEILEDHEEWYQRYKRDIQAIEGVPERRKDDAA